MKLESMGYVAARARAGAALELQDLVSKGDYAGAATLKARMEEPATTRTVTEEAKQDLQQSYQRQLNALVAAQDFAGAATLQKMMKMQSVRDVAASSRVDATTEVQALAAKGDYEDAAAPKPSMDEEASARSVMEAAN